MNLDIHTREELYRLDNETDKVKKIIDIAIEHNDEFLKIYANMLQQKLAVELNKYQYLVGLNVSTNSGDGVITEIRRFYCDSVLIHVKVNSAILSKTLKQINPID